MADRKPTDPSASPLSTDQRHNTDGQEPEPDYGKQLIKQLREPWLDTMDGFFQAVENQAFNLGLDVDGATVHKALVLGFGYEVADALVDWIEDQQ